jgi:hypothetical protein
MHAEETKAGKFVVTGFARKDITKEIYDAVLMEYDANGTVRWIKRYGTADADDQGYWVVINRDGSYTFAGYTHSHGVGGDLWLIRTQP